MIFLPLIVLLHQKHYLVIILFLIIVFLSFHGRWRSNPNLPPGPKPFPIIGNLHNLNGLPHIAFHRLYQKYGPIIYLKLGQVPSIVVSGADMVSEIMKSQDNVFCSRSQLTALRKFSYGGQDISFSPFGDHWKQKKRLCIAELLNLDKVQSFGSIRRHEVNTVVNAITKACSRKKAVNLSDTLLTFTINTIFQEVFERRISVDDGKHEWSQVQVHSILREMFCILAEFGAEDLFPYMGWIDLLTGWRRKLGRCFLKLDSMLEEKIRKRMLIMSGGNQLSVQDHCFLDHLLHLHEAEEGDQHLTINEIKAILMDIFVAGGGTTSTVIEWGMTQLMKNPSAMKRAQAEVRQAVGDKGEVEESDLQHLHYLKMVIKESLRLHPPGPLPPPHECMKETKVGGYDIAAKTMVYVSLWSAGRDP